MRHPDIELLTQFALDDPLALDAATLVHITDCAECRHEIEQVQRVVDATLAIGGRSDLRTLLTPSPAVWDRIVEELDADEAAPSRTPVEVDLSAVPILPTPEPVVDEPSWLFSSSDGDDGGASTEPRTYSESPPRRTAALQLLAAAVVGVIVGAGFTWVLSDNGGDEPPVTDVATSVLQPVNGHTGTGEVSLSGSTNKTVTVNFDASDADGGFIEVWLLDPKTNGMIALGVLDGPTGEFALPKNVNLGRYSNIDISVEPFDGDPLHSADSLARGPLPQT